MLWVLGRPVVHLGRLESDSVLEKEFCSLCVSNPLPSGLLLGELREFDEKIEQQARKMEAQELFLAKVSEGKTHHKKKTAID